MSLSHSLRTFVLSVVLIFLLSAVASSGSGLNGHGQGRIDWASSLGLALTVGVVLAIVKQLAQHRPARRTPQPAGSWGVRWRRPGSDAPATRIPSHVVRPSATTGAETSRFFKEACR